MKKTLALVLSALMLASTLASCGSSSSGSTVTGKTDDAYEVDTSEAVKTSGYQINEDLDLEEKVTLDVFGPGPFTSEDGVTDLVSGLYKPGFSEIIKRWNELYPNVTLNIEPSSWDSWQSAITTACLSGDVDVIMHGATMTDLTEDLAPYLEADPEYADSIYATASRRTTEDPSTYKVSGISVALEPAIVWLDTEIFEHYGVELPTEDWTFDDMISIAQQLTGTDPVTGEQTYGIQMFEAGKSNLWMNHMLTSSSLGAKIYEYGATLADCKVNYMTEESIGGFEIIAELAKYASPESKEGVAVNTVLDGTNNWAMLPRQQAIMAHFEMEASDMQDRYVPITLPVCTAGDCEGKPTPFAGDNNMAIYKDSDNKEWAWEFIKFMTTDEVATQWIVENMMYPNNKEGKTFVEDLVGTDLTSMMDSALGSLPENFNNATNDVFNNVSFGSTTNTQITAVDNVINGYMTPEEAAQSMQDYVDEYISSLG